GFVLCWVSDVAPRAAQSELRLVRSFFQGGGRCHGVGLGFSTLKRSDEGFLRRLAVTSGSVGLLPVAQSRMRRACSSDYTKVVWARGAGVSVCLFGIFPGHCETLKY
ncbi:unnamed protein product, partial [Hapterophycus canaliculatus]